MKEHFIGFKFEELYEEGPIMVKYKSSKALAREIEDALQSYFETALNEEPDLEDILHIITVVMNSFNVEWQFYPYDVVEV